jgi:hypothetical protein
MDDLELEALQKRYQQKFLASQLQDSQNPNADLGLQLAGGAMDVLSKASQANQDIASIATGIKGPNQAIPNVQNDIQRAIASRQSIARQKALDDQATMGTLQRMIEAKRDREEKIAAVERAERLRREALEREDQTRRESRIMAGYDPETLGAVPGGKAALELEQLRASIEKSRSEAAKNSKFGGSIDGIGRDFLVPGVGEALTKQDAKELKDAVVQKQKFDRQVQEMINLRKEYGGFGGEVMNRAAVARGQQLSKDLLLTYKKLQKLGVLSSSDEEIINAIIPSDPLQFTSPFGKDPILSNLEAFKVDSAKDYENNVNARTKQRFQKEIAPEDAEAIQWARSNPQDPDAQNILKLHGLL